MTMDGAILLAAIGWSVAGLMTLVAAWYAGQARQWHAAWMEDKIFLDQRNWDYFEAKINAPPEPTQTLKDLMKEKS
jgi:hypothetical protein